MDDQLNKDADLALQLMDLAQRKAFGDEDAFAALLTATITLAMDSEQREVLMQSLCIATDNVRAQFLGDEPRAYNPFRTSIN